MKTSEKISINPEKVIKNDELVNLRGGYDLTNCCLCTDEYNQPIIYMLGVLNASECEEACEDVYGGCADGEWNPACS